MSTPTQPKEAHFALLDAICVAQNNNRTEAAQVIADSEARAVERETALLRQLYASEKQAKVERGDMLCEAQDALTAEREKVRVLREALELITNQADACQGFCDTFTPSSRIKARVALHVTKEASK